jgi:hypothetical protein
VKTLPSNLHLSLWDQKNEWMKKQQGDERETVKKWMNKLNLKFGLYPIQSAPDLEFFFLASFWCFDPIENRICNHF